MDTRNLNTDQLFAEWLRDYINTLPARRSVLRIRRAQPLFVTRNYFARYMVETATLDGTGQNPTDVECLVVAVSATDQEAKAAQGTACGSISDL